MGMPVSLPGGSCESGKLTLLIGPDSAVPIIIEVLGLSSEYP